MLFNISTNSWDADYSADQQHQAVTNLENGHILYFPQLAFKLLPEEAGFLSPDYADPTAKNISYHSAQQKLWGVQNLNDEQHIQLKAMLERFSTYSYRLIKQLLPDYTDHLLVARTSFRPVQVSNRKTSYRKDDKRLHVDAFPSAPNQGKRILRVFCVRSWVLSFSSVGFKAWREC